MPSRFQQGQAAGSNEKRVNLQLSSKESDNSDRSAVDRCIDSGDGRRSQSGVDELVDHERSICNKAANRGRKAIQAVFPAMGEAVFARL